MKFGEDRAIEVPFEFADFSAVTSKEKCFIKRDEIAPFIASNGVGRGII